jgi:hypothetical protein
MQLFFFFFFFFFQPFKDLESGRTVPTGAACENGDTMTSSFASTIESRRGCRLILGRREKSQQSNFRSETSAVLSLRASGKDVFVILFVFFFRSLVYWCLRCVSFFLCAKFREFSRALSFTQTKKKKKTKIFFFLSFCVGTQTKRGALMSAVFANPAHSENNHSAFRIVVPRGCGAATHLRSALWR